MNFSISNGNNTLSVGLSDIGNYFQFNLPLSVVWDDYQGSTGRYFCLLPYSEAYRNKMEKLLLATAQNTSPVTTKDIYTLLQPLFQLFRNGSYGLQFCTDSKEQLFRIESLSSGEQITYYAGLQVLYATVTDGAKENEIRNMYQTVVAEGQRKEHSYVPPILDYSTSNVYTSDPLPFYATQPATAINQDRVAWYVSRITAGELPFAIVMNAICEDTYYHSDYFILDGHHKLMAYQQLGIYPPVAVITHLPAEDELEFDIEKLIAVLYPWQVAHILENWSPTEKAIFLREQLANPKSPLHRFIKNGQVRQYHENGKLKHEAFYVDDRIDGMSQGWFDDGKPEYTHFYKNGIRTGTWRQYHPSGKTAFVQRFDEQGNYDGLVISYYPDGGKWLQQVFSKGVHVDGYSYKSWFADGSREGVLKYKDGRMVERKSWNAWHQLVNHEVYDTETGKLRKKYERYSNTPPEDWFSETFTTERVRNFVVGLLIALWVIQALRKAFVQP